MKAADDMVDIIKEIVQQEIKKLDTTVLCEIASQVDDSHYDVYVVPDRNTKITNVENMTKYDLQPGDYCYVYKVQNNFRHSFICYKL